MTEELEDSLVEVLGRSGGSDLIEEAAEFSLDSLLSSETVKDVPVAGTVARLYGIAVGVQGYIFAKKVRRFLTELSSVSADEREKFVRLLESDSSHRERTAEALITLVDRMDDLEKAPLLARAFAGHIRGDYDFSTFRRLSSAIERCLVSDLQWLECVDVDRPKELESYVGDALTAAGLVTPSGLAGIGTADTDASYGLSHLGQLFRQVVLRGLERGDDA